MNIGLETGKKIMNFNYNEEVSKIEDSINEINNKLIPGHGGYMKYYIHSHYYNSKHIFNQIPDLSENDTLLEIGTYIGLPLILAKKKFGCKVLGTDVSKEIEKNKNFHKIYDLNVINVEFKNGDYPSLPFKNNSINCVIFSEVMEHLRVPPAQILAEIKRIITPNGCLIFSIPNIASSARISQLIVGQNIQPMFKNKIKEGGHITDVFGHVREYTKNEAVFLINQQNMIIEKLKLINNDGGVMSTIKRVLKKFFNVKNYSVYINPYDDVKNSNYIDRSKNMEGEILYVEKKFPLWGKVLSLILSLLPKYGESIIIIAKKRNANI